MHALLYTFKAVGNSACAKTKKIQHYLGSKHPFTNIFCEKCSSQILLPIPRHMPVPIMDNTCTCIHFQSSRKFCIYPTKKQSPQRVSTYPWSPSRKIFPTKTLQIYPNSHATAHYSTCMHLCPLMEPLTILIKNDKVQQSAHPSP